MKYASQSLMSSFIPFGGSLTYVFTLGLFSSSQTFNAVPMNPQPIIPTLILLNIIYYYTNQMLHFTPVNDIYVLNMLVVSF